MNITLFWIFVIAIFFLFLKENKNKALKKAIGSFLIVLGIFIFNPLPSLDDLLFYPLFSLAMGWDTTIQGLKQNILPYTIYSSILGLAISYGGLLLTGHNLTYLKNKIRRL